MEIGKVKLKLSITDLHLFFQIAAFQSETIAQETVKKLKFIQQDLEEDGQESDLMKSQRQIKAFDKYIDKITHKGERQQTSGVEIMAKLSQAIARFKQVAVGYTGQQYRTRENFLDFIRKDILQIEEELEPNKDYLFQ